MNAMLQETEHHPIADRGAAKNCRESFEIFVREFWPEVPGAGTLLWSPHMTILCEEMQVVAERVFANLPKLYDLIINISPGTSKSSICSILFHPWTWTRMPQARHINASHTDALVLDLAGKARSVIESDKYQRYFPEVQMKPDQNSKGDYANTLGGERKSCTVAGKSPTGRHAVFLLVDDPIDPKKAISEAELKTASDFMTQVLPSRKIRTAVDLAVTITIMQRLGINDPTDVLLKVAKRDGATKIRRICLPAELSDDVCPKAYKRLYVDGLMDPVRLPKHVLDDFRARLGEYGYAGQFMQRPVPLKGGMFKVEWFSQRVKAAPYHAEKRIRYWDRAASEGQGCWSVGILMAYAQGNYYIEHMERGQWEPDERNEKMRATALRDRGRYAPNNEPMICVEREGGSSGRDAWKGIARALAGFNVMEDTVTGSKDTRAEPWAAQCAARNVWLVEDSNSPWDIEAFIQEHILFRPMPGQKLGRYKDIVDSCSGAFNKIIASSSGAGTMRVLISSPTTGKQTLPRIVVCSKDELKNTIINERSILIALNDPGDSELPVNGLNKIIDSVVLQFADIHPAEHQERWGEPVPPWNEPAERLIMQPNDGKRLWKIITQKRSDPWHVMVIVDSDDRRAVSAAYAIADIWRMGRKKVIYLPRTSDNSLVDDTAKAPNEHVYHTVKAARNMVM